MEYLNPVIICALVIQSIILKANHFAGSIVGFLITSGILFWGLSLYSEGNAIAFFGIVLTQPVFIIACLIWYVFDVLKLVKGGQIENSKESA